MTSYYSFLDLDITKFKYNQESQRREKRIRKKRTGKKENTKCHTCDRCSERISSLFANRGLPINTIKTLLLHVLENSFFVLQLPSLEPKFYKQIKGGAMGSACTQILADIYMGKWETP